MNAEHVKKAKFRKPPAVEFERTPLKVKLKSKLTSLFFLKKIVWIAFRLILLVGIAFQILKPYLQWLPESIMAPDDFIDVTVQIVPKNISFDMYKAVWHELHYFKAFFNTLTLSVTVALLQTFVCCFIAYGLAKFKFKGNKLVFIAVILSLIIPHKTLQYSMQWNFSNFDVLGIFQFLNGGGINLFGFSYTNDFLASIDIIPDSWTVFAEGSGVSLLGTNWPLIILSIFGLAFKNGLYIFMLRQFFSGVPNELEESAYIDGSGIMKTFFTIILPLSVPMLITVFLFAFSWQWTDKFYTQLFSVGAGKEIHLLKDLMGSAEGDLKALSNMITPGYKSAITHTAGLMVIAPLVVVYLFFQKYLVQGIERSGLTAD